ncbi:hypothetical protein ACFRFH_15390 [Leifsonia sp. NPDC056824]|uniref:hypothetical protein n=1 Tax=Leifsonia sp. NPDC056824 TaxID=3345953 RepID=UPI00369E335F
MDTAQYQDPWPDPLTVNTFDELEAFARELVGATAIVEVGALENGAPYIEVVPNRSGARAVNIIADQWIVFAVEGSGGGRWELAYDTTGRAFAQNALAAVTAGRLDERVAFGRSQLTLTFEDGSTHAETGYHGCLAVITPQPGWRRWGEVRGAQPYA